MSSIATLVRLDCPRCGPQMLHDGLKCIHCRKAAPAPRKRRIASVDAELAAAAAWRLKRAATPAKRVGNGRAQFGRR
jgi:tRNA(Ile2) C34 agmatinyltransferase TiaS